jgi:hypothetical protein
MAGPPIRTTLSLPAIPVHARQLYLVFNPTRATVIKRPPGAPVLRSTGPDFGVLLLPGVRWTQHPTPFEGRPRELFPHIIALDLDAGALEQSVEIVIESLDERPELVQCIAVVDDKAIVIQSAGDSACLDTANLRSTEVPVAGGAFLSDVQVYLDETKLEIEKLTDKVKRDASWFFFDLDRQSEEKLSSRYLTSGSPITTAIEALQPALKGRMENRVQRRKSLPNACGPEFFPVADPMRRVTDLFFDGLSRHLFAKGAITLPEVEDAFELFATGQLRLRTQSGFWSTQPSSGWYFYFAELALLGGEEGHVATALLTPVERALWRSLANVLVRTQVLFTEAYAASRCPGVPPARVAAPFPEDYCGCALDLGAVTGDRIRAVRAEYAALTFADLFDRAAANAEQAFGGWSQAIVACP